MVCLSCKVVWIIISRQVNCWLWLADFAPCTLCLSGLFVYCVKVTGFISFSWSWVENMDMLFAQTRFVSHFIIIIRVLYPIDNHWKYCNYFVFTNAETRVIFYDNHQWLRCIPCSSLEPCKRHFVSQQFNKIL